MWKAARSPLLPKFLNSCAPTRRCLVIPTSNIVKGPTIPLETKPLATFVAQRGRWHDENDDLALLCAHSNEKLTFRQLHGRVNAAARALRDTANLQKGDVVHLHLHNCVEFVVAFFATIKLGGVVTTSNPAYTASELAHTLEDSGATLSLTSRAYQKVVDEAIPLAGGKVKRVWFVEDRDDCFACASESYDDDSDLTPSLDPLNDVAVIPYSSGTTGKAKGVCLTHRNLTANVQQCSDLEAHKIGIHEGDRLVGVLPLFHIYGMTVLMCVALATRASVVLLPKFEPEAFLRTLQDYRVNTAMVAPPLALFMAKHPMVEGYDLTSLRDIFSGAAPLDASLQAALAKRLNCSVRQGYGMTETSPIVSYCSKGPGSYGGAVGSAGIVAPSTEFMVIDGETTQALPLGEEGELCIRGPQVMQGYLNRPDATSESMLAEGFLRTGDLARLDEEGTVWIGDRVKELIKVKGFQVAPAELEGLLLEIPEVADACVIGVADERAGEVPKAFVVRAAGSSIDVEALQRYLHPKLADFKHPQLYEFVDTIPKSASGKILRRLLRKQ